MTHIAKTFDSFGLNEELLHSLQDLNFVSPSPIQEQTIPTLLEGRDLIGLAQTGTGKTAAFSLPILQRLQKSVEPQALIIAPTRELAIQVAAHIETLAAKLKGIKVAVLCGGQDYRPQLKMLKEGAQIVVGTPGRILDHLDKKSLKLGSLKTFVLDEADEMLRMGFIEDVETILATLPKEKQIALFSATMPPRIRQIAKRYLNDPVTVEIKMDTATVKSIEQRFLFASIAQKSDALIRVLAVENYQGVIVFVRTKSSTEQVANLLQQNGHKAIAIHGDLTQSLRERIIVQFKEGTIDILVATDVAARGLDVERVTHVINYDIAHDCETYVHRIGRTGRAGRSGKTILFVTPKESRLLNNIERHTRQPIEKIAIPNNEMIQKAKQDSFFGKIKERLNHHYLPTYRKILEDYFKINADSSPLDVAAALALMLNNDAKWDAKLPDLKAMKEGYSSEREGRFSDRKSKDFKSSRQRNSRDSDVRRTKDSRNSRDSKGDQQQETFRLDVGSVHGVKPRNIVGAIANEAGLNSSFITSLKIHENYSTVKLPKGMSKEVVKGLNKAWVCGRQLNLMPVSREKSAYN